MADDLGDRTEAPTPRRRQEARDRGQVARSQELSASVLLLTTLIGLKLFGAKVWMTMVAAIRSALAFDGPADENSLLPMGLAMLLESARSVAPLLGLLILATLVVQYAQVGWIFTWKPVQPDLTKLSPVRGVKRLFSTESLVRFAQNLLKLVFAVFVVWLSIQSVVNQVLLAHTLDHRSLFGLGAGLVFDLGIRLAIVLFLLSLLDYAYQRYKHEKQLRMTKEEVKEEMKRMDGDPVIKRRRREVQLRLAAQRLKQTVPQADVVVTNPTHYSVALRYDAETMAAPTVVAKGVDYLAQRIREIATSSGVPIVERPALARMLYSDVEVGRAIPERFYKAVAEVLAYVFELAGRNMGPTPVPIG